MMRPRDLLKPAFLKRLALLTAGVAVVGVLVVVSGVISIKASSGHWAITEWFLSFTMRRSVATRSMGIEVPDLDDPSLVLKGATHYEAGCKPCHGAPGAERSGVARESTPEPPWLPDELRKWDDQALFYIVKHGVKFTGMPAWPAQGRDDEVWAVVAFLRRLPELDPAAYLRLALGERADEAASVDLTQMGDVPEPVLESCARCHGRDGTGRGYGAFPKLTGQKVDYLLAQLEAYSDGRRHSGIMQPVATSLDPWTMRQVALYYGVVGGVATLPAGPATPAAGAIAAQLALGEAIARRGLPELNVPSCVDCHGPEEGPHNSHFPVLAGQYPEYLALQLRLFKEGRRGGSPFHVIMREVAPNLTAEQIEAVARWYGSLGGGGVGLFGANP